MWNLVSNVCLFVMTFNQLQIIQAAANFSIGVFHKFHKPPWGGGNQFLMALTKELRSRDMIVEEVSDVREDIGVYLGNAITFKFERVLQQRKTREIIMVHRVDGPYYSARYAKDPRLHRHDPWRAGEDEQVWRLNAELACATIFQSKWSYDMNLLLGYKIKEPYYIIPNGVDDSIFNANNRVQWDISRKIRLISSAWAANERKGYKSHKWLDDNLDFTKYEYLFIGNVVNDLTFSNIKHRKPTGSKELGDILRSMDIYIAASYLEPCSNALLEALACGLPVLFQKGSGHDDLVKQGGIGYSRPEEIPALLDTLVRNYSEYQSRIKVESMRGISDRYLSVMKRCNKASSADA